MTKEELRKKFIVGTDVLKARIEDVATKALEHCVVGEDGTVHIETKALPAKSQIKLVLAARSVASQLDDSLSADVNVSELARSTGLPENQIRARATDAVKERFATSRKQGVYAANPHKIEAFLDSLKKAKK